MKKRILFINITPAYLILLIFLLSSINFQSLAQNTRVYSRGGENIYNLPADMKNVKGSMFLNEEFINGKIYLKDESSIDGAFRYNMFNEEIQGIINGDSVIITETLNIDHLTIGEQSFMYSNYGQNNSGLGVFEILATGYCKLLLKRNMTIKREKETVNLNYEGGNYVDRFVTQDVYYIKRGNASLLVLKKNKKKILNLLSDREDELGEFISKNKIKVSKDPDLIKLFDYYNSLLQE